MSIQITELTKRFAHNVTALDRLSLTIGTGMYGLLGANGAGKTTLMRILAGVIRPTSGTVIVNGHDMATNSGRHAVQQRLGYLPQHLGLYPDLTACAFLDYIALLKGLDDKHDRSRRVAETLELVGLTDLGTRKTGSLSGGMKRRLGIAQALLTDSHLIIVDEPTAGLDPEERIRFRNLLTSLAGQRTVLLSTHIVEDVASSCRQLAILSRGRVLYAGDTAGVTATAHGKTWDIQLPIGVAPQGDLTVVAALQRDDHINYRVISSGAYPVDGTPLEPTLEDGYLALLRQSDPAGLRTAS